MNVKTMPAVMAAAREGHSTLVIKNARVVNVFTDEIVEADVAVFDDTVIGVGSYSADLELDAKGAYLAPGFIDAHMHIESTMVTPSTYAGIVLPHGTTAVIADPHEIANVAGMKGIYAMLEASEGLPLSVYFMLPSCVPATPFEHNGAVLSAQDLAPLKAHPRVLGLGEVMNYVGVVNGDTDMMEKLSMFYGGNIDGHAPLLTGRDLAAYCVAGPMTDHECSNFEEVREKLRAGMRVMIRVGSAANGVEELLSRIAEEKLPVENLLFCSDDKHIENIQREGHINHNMRLAVAAGLTPFEAIRMATLNPARAYGLARRGAVAPGYRADLVLLEDLKEFKVRKVITGGRIYRGAEQLNVNFPAEILGGINIAPMDAEKLRLPVKGEMPVIRLVPGQLMTELTYAKVPERDGCFLPDGRYTKLAVVERHHGTGHVGVGIVEGLNLKNGAIAATVAHDSHNLVVAGDNDADILRAIDTLCDCGGGFAVVSRGVVLARLPLPIAGLMTDAPVEDVLARQRALLDAAASLGAGLASDPLVTLSFLALPVIPEVRLTDMGLFDVMRMAFIE
ncbi:MAG: adenine deaminase [Clostridia bacterium]|nr:adenine deaminase [Clostridia bacterium]